MTTNNTDIYRLRLRNDCNLILTRNGSPFWVSGTIHPDTRCRLEMQTDGNLVLYASTGIAIWATNTFAFPGATLTLQTDGNLTIYRSDFQQVLWSTYTGYIADQLRPGQHLSTGDSLYTEHHVYQLIMQSDCNLVIYQGGTAIWHSRTYGQGTNCRTEMQTDGNLVIYDATGTAKWNTQTNGQAITLAALQNNGKLTLNTANNSTVWTT